MARTELPWLIAGRLVRPYALAVSLACASLGALIVSGQSRYGVGYWSHTVGGFCFLAGILLWVGWWHGGTKGDSLMRQGLLLSACAFAARGTYMALTGQALAGAFVACWALASAGAYLLEATTAGDQRQAWSTRHGAEAVNRE